MSESSESMFVDRRPVSSGGGLPWLLTAGALLAGIALARAIDWRAHAHRRL